jgi:hypothetical protein
MARPAGVVRSSATVRGTKPTPMFKLPERRNQIGDGPAPLIQAPYHHNIDFTAARGSEQCFAQLSLGAGADLSNLPDETPAAPGCVFAHGSDLQRQRLLVVAGNAGVEACPLGVAKNLARLDLRKSLFSGLSGV